MVMGYNAKHADVTGHNSVWAFLYQCDNRFRHEHMPRMLRAVFLKLDRLIARASNGEAILSNDLEDGQSVDSGEKQPFEYLWSLPDGGDLVEWSILRTKRISF